MLITLASLLFTLPALAAETGFKAPSAEQVLETLNPEHPRVMITKETLRQLKKDIQEDELLRQWVKDLQDDALKLLGQPPSHYEIPDGRRLLSVSRRVKERVRALGLIYCINRDPRLKKRLWAELEAAAKFKDWNPSHFLDTAEMTHAFAMGYDWLYHEWSEEQRATLRTAIIKLGLEPAMEVYKKKSGWHKNVNNWNQVCNGGIGTGALAIADEEPELAAQILHNAIKSLPLAMSHYAPDGGGTEGVTYWDYGSRYNIIFLSALDTALGTDFGLSQIPGFEASGEYQMHLSGAGRLSFNFGDCGLRTMGTSQHLWMAKRFKRPEFSWFRHEELRQRGISGGPLDLIWYDASGRDLDKLDFPLDKHFRGAESASMRSAWNDPNALVLGIQAGDSMNLGGHRHIDLGGFVLEALGERWAIDSGSDHETYMRHRHHNPRWFYYRIRAEGHNTLVLNPGDGPDQNIKAIAKITRFDSAPNRAEAVVDLSQAYQDHAHEVTRTFAMIDRERVTVTDEVRAKQPADLWWFMHTEAEVKLGRPASTATLRKNGKQLAVRILEPAGAVFTVMDAQPLPTSPNPQPQEKNKGRRKLAIHLPDTTSLKLTVSFEPLR